MSIDGSNDVLYQRTVAAICLPLFPICGSGGDTSQIVGLIPPCLVTWHRDIRHFFVKSCRMFSSYSVCHFLILKYAYQ